jgi:hypothetical protein
MVDGADGLEEIETAPPRHLLVEQYHAIRLPLKQHQGIISVGAGLDGEALFFKKENVGREALDLIINPQDAFGAGHELNIDVNVEQ